MFLLPGRPQHAIGRPIDAGYGCNLARVEADAALLHPPAPWDHELFRHDVQGVIILIKNLRMTGEPTEASFFLRMFKYSVPVTMRFRITNWDLPPAWKASPTCNEPPLPAMAYCIQSSWWASPWSVFIFTRTSTLCSMILVSSLNNTWCQWLTVRLQWDLVKLRCNPLQPGVRRGFPVCLLAL